MWDSSSEASAEAPADVIMRDADAEADEAEEPPTVPGDDEPTIIDDERTDVATRTDLEQMRVGIPERQLFQFIYLWTSSTAESSTKKATNSRFKPTTDSALEADADLRPTEEELTPKADAKRYMIVGIVVGSDPEIYQVSGKAGGVDKDERSARLDRGALDPHPHRLRAVVPQEDTIVDAPRYYVACRRSGGRAYPRVIKAKTIFFFPEFVKSAWEGNQLSPRFAATRRAPLIGRRIAFYAAANKIKAEGPRASLTVEGLANWTPSSALTVSPSNNLVNNLIFQYMLFQQTDDVKYLQVMANSIKDASPDLDYGPSTQIWAVKEFLDFESDFESAKELIKELTSVCEDASSWSPEFVNQVRGLLIEEDMWQRLPRAGLAFFLAAARDLIDDEDADAVKIRSISTALKLTKRHVEMGNSSWTSSTENRLEKNDYLAIVWSIREFLNNHCGFYERSMKAIVDQHGPVIKQKSLQSLMRALGNAVSTSEVMFYGEQMAAIHALQCAGQYGKGVEKLREFVKLLDKVIGDWKPDVESVKAVEVDDFSFS